MGATSASQRAGSEAKRQLMVDFYDEITLELVTCDTELVITAKSSSKLSPWIESTT